MLSKTKGWQLVGESCCKNMNVANRFLQMYYPGILTGDAGLVVALCWHLISDRSKLGAM